MPQSTDTDIRELKDLILGLDKKIDVLDKKVDISTARTEERLKALENQVGDLKKSTDTQFADLKKSTDTQFADLKKSTDTQLTDLKKSTDTQLTDIKVQLRSQDNRLWAFLVAMFLAVLGFTAKLILFPTTLS